MTLYLSDPGAPGEKTPPRPPIWAGAPRRSAPDLRAIGEGTLLRSRKIGAPLVTAGAARLAGFAARVEAGTYRVNAARLGVLARFVPSSARVGRGLRGTAALIAASAETVAPPPPIEALPLRPWDGAPGAIARPSPVADDPPAPLARKAPDSPRSAAPPAALRTTEATDENIEAERDTLDAIRTLMRAEARPTRPQRQPKAETAAETTAAPRALRGVDALPPLEPHVPTPPGFLFRGAAKGLGWAFLALMLPVGGVVTLWLVLRGREVLPEG
jgi:hypothetical protein